MHPPAFQFDHGDHISLFYQSEESLTEILVPYLAEGLQKKEKCFCVQKPEVAERLRRQLSFAGINVEKEIARGALLFQTVPETYFPDGTFRPEAMIEMLSESIAATTRDGFSGFRTAGDLAWAMPDPAQYRRIIDYEQMVPWCCPGGPFTGLCQYPAKELPPALLRSLHKAHSINLLDPNPPSMYTWIQLIEPPFVAEIITDKFAKGAGYTYIIRRDDSEHVLLREDAPDFAAARARARIALQAESAKNNPA